MFLDKLLVVSNMNKNVIKRCENQLLHDKVIFPIFVASILKKD